MKIPDSLPDHLREVWCDLVDQVKPAIGTAGMEALCGQVYRMRDAQRRITEEGLVVLDAKGNPAPHPAIAVEKQASAEVRAWVKEFGARFAAR